MKFKSIFTIAVLSMPVSASLAESATGLSTAGGGRIGEHAGEFQSLSRSPTGAVAAAPTGAIATTYAAPTQTPSATQAAAATPTAAESEPYALACAGIAAVGFLAYRRKVN